MLSRTNRRKHQDLYVCLMTWWHDDRKLHTSYIDDWPNGTFKCLTDLKLSASSPEMMLGSAVSSSLHKQVSRKVFAWSNKATVTWRAASAPRRRWAGRRRGTRRRSRCRGAWSGSPRTCSSSSCSWAAGCRGRAWPRAWCCCSLSSTSYSPPWWAAGRCCHPAGEWFRLCILFLTEA